MNRVGNINRVSNEFIWADDAGLVTKALGHSTGSEKIYANLDSVPAKGYSTKYHSHSQQEEFFYVVSGAGILNLNGEELEVKTGDFFAKPAGKGICHTFYNPGPEPLLILDVGTNEKEDTCYYPDEEVYLHKSAEGVHIFKEDALMKTWSSDPNV